MKQLIFIFFCVLLSHCAKEAPAPANTTSSTADSLLGRWKYIYDYRLVAAQANPTVIIDSVYGGNYAPYSYFELKNDSTYKWYRTASQALPTIGYGQSGKWWWVESTRNIGLSFNLTTGNDFITTTAINPPSTSPGYNIKFLSKDSAVLYFRVLNTAASQYYYWHDVFVK